jgi:hypothetical protein
MSLFGHFYYSETQKRHTTGYELLDAIFGKPDPAHVCICQLEDDGQICEYTQMSNEPMRQPYRFTDMVYLGYGVVHMVDGVLQNVESEP